ncbi:MAG: hypothetical protein H6825_08045 [Planctomycetes bacterium]|nr:hypothetical protein [Planctomycetota bacterium]
MSSSVRPFLARACGAWLVLLLLACASRAQAFDPARHLPEGAVAVLDCAGFDAWAAACGDSWTGRWFAHPRTQQALAGLKGTLARLALQVGAPAWAATGIDPTHLRDLLGGRLVVALYDVDARLGPKAVLALDTRGHGAELFAAVRHVFALRGDQPGTADGVPDSLRITSHDGASLEAALLGDALVLAANVGLADVHALFAADDGQGSLGATPFGAALAQGLGAERPALRLALDGRALVDRVRAGPGATNPDVLEFLDVSGVGRIGFAGAVFGFRGDGTLEQRALLTLDRPAPAEGDVLDAVLTGLSHPVEAGALTPLLARLPADAVMVGASRFDPADLVRRVEAVFSSRIPVSRDDIADLWSNLEQHAGVTRAELLALPAVTFVSVGTEPGSGGLLPDSVSLVRDDELDPWWTLLERVLQRIDVPFTDRDLGGVTLRSVDWAAAFGEGRAIEQLAAAQFGGMSDTSDVDHVVGLVGMAFTSPVQDVARASLGDGVSVIGMLPQSVERHLRARGTPRLGGELLALATRRLPGHVGASVMQGSRLAPAVYDTLLALSGALSPALGALGIDSAYLPPSELVVADPPAWHAMSFDATPDRLELGGDGPLATPVVLLAAAGAAMLFGAAGSEVVEYDARIASSALHDERMRHLHDGLVAYARSHDGAFPRNHDPVVAFQMLIDDAPPGAWTADDFVSPLGAEGATWNEQDGRPQLDFWTCSWRMVPWPVTLDDDGILFFDSKSRGWQRRVCHVDGTLLSIDEDEFLATLAAQRKARLR